MAGRLARLVGPLAALVALALGAHALARAPAAAPHGPPAAGAGPLAGPDRATPGSVAAKSSRRAARSGISADQLRSRLAAQMRATGGASGAFVVDLDASGGGPLFTWASKTPRILASNMKLFTTAALLERYGPKTTFTTHVWAVGRRTGPGGRVLDGRLALVGAGDPTLADGGFARAFDLPVTRLGPLAAAVSKAGIRVVRHGILADGHIFDGRNTVPQAGITGGPFLGSLAGLDYNSGFVRGHLADHPPIIAAHAFEQKLEADGVKVKGPTKPGKLATRVRHQPPLGGVSSPPVGSLIKATNTPSNDFFAEMLLKRLAAAGDHRGTTARGAEVVERFATHVGSSVRTQNGSGLSRIDRASPRDVVHLLAAMDAGGDAAIYRRSLAIPCKSGTLAQRMCGTSAADQCHAKTGTLSDVSALSGYCVAADHHLLAFSLLMNGVSITAAHVHQDAIAALLARYNP
jgi:D-alanyl-D-alanine carboxypeptidase/D-alanyl-D-alanine-endopeptidase (penicillin-binding protein 4)